MISLQALSQPVNLTIRTTAGEPCCWRLALPAVSSVASAMLRLPPIIAESHPRLRQQLSTSQSATMHAGKKVKLGLEWSASVDELISRVAELEGTQTRDPIILFNGCRLSRSPGRLATRGIEDGEILDVIKECAPPAELC